MESNAHILFSSCYRGVLKCIYQFLSAFEIYCNIIHFQRFNLTLSVVKSNCVILYGQPEEHFSIFTVKM